MKSKPLAQIEVERNAYSLAYERAVARVNELEEELQSVRPEYLPLIEFHDVIHWFERAKVESVRAAAAENLVADALVKYESTSWFRRRKRALLKDLRHA